MDLSGKTAFVTGAASGVGLAASRQFAEAGARVVLADRNDDGVRDLAGTLSSLGHRVHAVVLDVSEEDSVRLATESAVAEFGTIDILFNNAAVGPSSAPVFPMANVLETPADAWDAILSINLKGPALVSRAVLPHMLRTGSGVIVNTSSINGLVAVPGADAYTASKGGLIALTRAMAVEFGHHGIRVNCICPGPIDTPMNQPYLSDPLRVQAMTDRIPLGRVADADEIASVAVFLATDGASYLNGAIIPVDGGWTAG